MKSPWWLNGLWVVLAALPLQAQDEPEDASELPPMPPAATVPASPPVVIESDAPLVIETEPQVVEVPAAEVTPRPALGVRFFRGTQVAIADVVDDSPADYAGLRRGDRIISFNGVFPATTDEFIALVASAPLDAASQIVVVRGGERHSIKIDPDAWNTVFSEPYVAARVDLDDDHPDDDGHAHHYHAPYHYHSPYFVWNMSPVVVPASWYVPYPYPYPYYYTAYWGYYPAAYYWPYAWPYYWGYPAAWGAAPYPYHHHHHHDHDGDDVPDQDSAGLDAQRAVTARFAPH